MFVAITSDGRLLEGNTESEIISQIKENAPDGACKLYRQVATVVRLPEVLIFPEKQLQSDGGPPGSSTH